MAARYQVVTRGELVSFESPYTTEQALSKLVELVRSGKLTSDFARSLVSGGIRSAKVEAWVHKLVVDAEQRSSVAASAVSVSFAPVVDLIKRAHANGLKRPAVVFQVEGQTVKMAMAGPTSRYAGDVFVTDGGRFGENKYFGRISAETGTLTSGRDMTPAIVSLITQLAQDPAAAAAEYGRRTGTCCFCNRPLEDERSTYVGYGPVCAERFGLPWGGPDAPQPNPSSKQRSSRKARARAAQPYVAPEPAGNTTPDEKTQEDCGERKLTADEMFDAIPAAEPRFTPRERRPRFAALPDDREGERRAEQRMEDAAGGFTA